MTTSSTRRTHRLTSPTDVLDAIPYLLGFRPTESLVLVGLTDGIVTVTARLDLADTGQSDLLDETVAGLHRGGVAQFVLVVFDDGCPAPPDLPAPPWLGAVAAVGRVAGSAGIDVVEAFLVCRGRWWSYLCGEPECCPVQGRPLAAAPTAFAAASTYDGIAVLPDRAALAATLDPLPEPERAALRPLLRAAEHAAVAAVVHEQVADVPVADVPVDSVPVASVPVDSVPGLGDRPAAHERAAVRELVLAARASAIAGWQPPDDATAARLAVALTSLPVRDELWMAIDSRRIDGRELWGELARRCPSPYDAAPLFLLGWASWRAGNGAVAGIAAERALASDPRYSAADLLLAALGHALDPRTFPPLRGEVDARVTSRRRRARRAGAARTRR